MLSEHGLVVSENGLVLSEKGLVSGQLQSMIWERGPWVVNMT